MTWDEPPAARNRHVHCPECWWDGYRKGVSENLTDAHAERIAEQVRVYRNLGRMAVADYWAGVLGEAGRDRNGKRV